MKEFRAAGVCIILIRRSQIQQNFQNILSILESLKDKNPKMAAKLKNGMKSIQAQLLSLIK